MTKLKNIFCGFFFLILSLSLTGQGMSLDIQILNVEDGLPSRRVHSINQDLDGYMWFSFVGLIARYDGHSFKKYDTNFLNTREGVNIRLAIDKNNYVWYCENKSPQESIFGGVINTELDRIYTFESISNGLIRSSDVVYINQSKVSPTDILIATRNGNLYRYDGQFHKIGKHDQLESAYFYMNDFSDGVCWLSTDRGISKFQNQKITNRIFMDKDPKKITKVYGEYFIKTDFGGTISLSKLDEKNTVVPFQNKKPQNSADEILTIYEIDENYYCLITVQDIIIKDKKDKKDKKVLRYQSPKNTQNGLIFIDTELFIDKQNTLWFTSENGLIKITLKQNPFSIIDAGNSVRGIAIIDDELWVGGYFGNQATNLKTNKKRAFLPTKFAGMGYSKDENGHIWLGTSTKIFAQYIPESKELKYFEHPKKKSVYLSFFNPETNHLWLGTDDGLDIFNRSKNTFTKVELVATKEIITVRQFFEKGETVWLITSKGIFIVDKKTEKVLRHYNGKNGLLYENLNYIHQDKDGIFWIGTRGNGLLYWNESKGICKQFTKENGLSNDNIYAVYEDEFNALWLPSDYGLMRFDKNSFESRVYLLDQGIAHEEFNTFANYQDKNGRLYFGGLNGVTAFHPKDLVYKSPYTPALKITQVKVLKADEDFFRTIPFNFSKDKKITLEHSDKIIELHLAFLDFSNATKNKYAYKIKGYHSQWIYLDKNVISLVNLPYGNYDLEIKARGGAGVWSGTTESITIVIKPPFYLRTDFIILTIILLFVISSRIIWWRINKFKLDKIRLETEVAKRTETIQRQAEDLKELDKAKTRFFSNITHEFRTPLTLIIGPLEQIFKGKATANPVRINGILRNAHRLLELINQLLDLSKLEGGQMQIEVTHGDIIYYTNDIIEAFEPLANKKNQQIHFIKNEVIWEINFDKDKWAKIVFNLLSNAIKFTPEGGKIQITLQKTTIKNNDFIHFIISDNGMGIDKNKINTIFNRFYQVDATMTRVQDGTGIGLSLVKELVELQKGEISVESKIKEGTTFTLFIPIQNEANSIIQQENDTPILPIIQQEKTTPIPIKIAENDKKLQVLIIEDNDEMRQYIRNCIDESIYQIIEASDGEQGIQLATEFVPDVIISDLMMPKKNGYEVIQTVRNQLSTSHIPLILLTAKTALESRLEGIEKGADAYLTKPFSPEELTLRIKKLIEIRELLQVRYRNNFDNSPIAKTPTALKNEVKSALENTFENTLESLAQEDEFVQNIKAFVLKNIEESELNGEIIGKEFNMSRMQLHRKVKALTNLTAGEFIRTIRLAKATEFMRTTEMNISEIAYATGFSSPVQFSKTFKKELDQTPSDYLKQIKNK
jgi:signal transduction histidine kinase/DNA-binding response OmpR family regulator/ligand-binding sensor domain-containing protein